MLVIAVVALFVGLLLLILAACCKIPYTYAYICICICMCMYMYVYSWYFGLLPLHFVVNAQNRKVSTKMYEMFHVRILTVAWGVNHFNLTLPQSRWLILLQLLWAYCIRNCDYMWERLVVNAIVILTCCHYIPVFAW